jgi:hypothetical protein
MIGIGDWVVKMIFHRLRGLGVGEIKDLIRHSDELQTLKVIRLHLQSGNFKWANVGFSREELMKTVDERASELLQQVWGG